MKVEYIQLLNEQNKEREKGSGEFSLSPRSFFPGCGLYSARRLDSRDVRLYFVAREREVELVGFSRAASLSARWRERSVLRPLAHWLPEVSWEHVDVVLDLLDGRLVERRLTGPRVYRALGRHTSPKTTRGREKANGGERKERPEERTEDRGEI